jgi:hypothetical protein
MLAARGGAAAEGEAGGGEDPLGEGSTHGRSGTEVAGGERTVSA